MKKNKYETISQYLFVAGIFLISFIFFNVLISSVLFIIHISISIFTPIISLIVSILLILLIIKKNNFNFKKGVLLSILLPILIIIFSNFISSFFIDYTVDGNSYHKTSIGFMMDGWNPVYEKIEEFNATSKNSKYMPLSSIIWSNHYAKASHIYAANIGKLTGNIECGKSINLISAIALFLLLFSTLIHKKKKVLFPLLLSLGIITLPTISSQLLTNYVDNLVYIYFFQLILCFFLFEKSNLFNSKKEFILLYFMTLIIGINIKFSLFGYLGLYCLGYYIWYIIRTVKKELKPNEIIKFTGISATAVLIAIFLVGLSTYPKNYIEKGNPFYPIIGKGKIDIMTSNQPEDFKGKSAVEKYFISTYSKSENIIESQNKKATFKVPFTVYKSEFKAQATVDLRLGGNGIFYSGILTISFVLLIYLLIKIYKKDKVLFYLISIPILITIVMIFTLSESWWARYFPQTHLIIIFTLLLLDEYNNTKLKKIIYILIVFLAINNSLVLGANLYKSLKYTNEINSQFKSFEKNTNPNKCELELYSESFPGSLYNIIEREKKYNVTFINKKQYQTNKEEFKSLFNEYTMWNCKK